MTHESHGEWAKQPYTRGSNAIRTSYESGTNFQLIFMSLKLKLGYNEFLKRTFVHCVLTVTFLPIVSMSRFLRQTAQKSLTKEDAIRIFPMQMGP